LLEQVPEWSSECCLVQEKMLKLKDKEELFKRIIQIKKLTPTTVTFAQAAKK
jgi:hypothetical protein